MNTPAFYSRSQTRDLQTAMAIAVASVLADGDWPAPGGVGRIRFSQVYEQWPTTNDRYVTPAACVLPSGELSYSESHLTPRLLEDTWEPKGSRGVGLYELSEAEMDFEVQVRAASRAERGALVAGVETSFVEPIVINGGRPARYGIVRPMREYWGLPIRLSLQGKRLEDGTESATKNRWEATFTVRAQAAQVVLGPVSPFTIRVVERTS